MPKGRTGATAGQRAKKLTGKPTLEESGSLRPYLEGAPVCLARPDKEVQVRIQIGETLDFTEDDGGRRRDLTKETW